MRYVHGLIPKIHVAGIVIALCETTLAEMIAFRNLTPDEQDAHIEAMRLQIQQLKNQYEQEIAAQRAYENQ